MLATRHSNLQRVSLEVVHVGRTRSAGAIRGCAKSRRCWKRWERRFSAVVASRLTDKNRGALMFSGETARWPEVQRKAAIKSDSFEGFFHVAVSTRDVWVETLWVSVIFLMLGLAAHYCFTRWPLAALDAVRGCSTPATEGRA